MAGKQTLKDPNVCRIFFSSPFLGMEKEREELTRRYFPQLHHLCNSKGIQFAAVDMRWGITSESTQSARTIDICLRELDRSDIFVGFFGQRYGWNGVNDEALQENFNVALPHFPWLENFRDKSVSELEFLHGFLNSPGQRPTCVCFRNKAWDDKLRAEAEAKGDVRGVAKFSPENEHSAKMLDELKERVGEVEETCLGVNMAYQSPEEGAKFMFNTVWKYLNEELLVDPPGAELDAAQQQMLQHDAFCESRCGLYTGGTNYISILDETVNNSSSKGIVIIGEPGVGKSALLSNWIKGKKNSKDFGLILYHFIGFPEHSTEIKNIMNRLSSSINSHFGDKYEAPEDDRATVGQFNTLLADAAKRVSRVCLVIDGLEKLDKKKTGKHLFWIPSSLPTNVTVIASTASSDDSTIDELVESRGYGTLKIEGMKMEYKQEMCLAMLKTNSKDLPGDQLEMIVAPQETQNPLYLKIVMQELCVVDYYRKIKGKIEHLLSSNSIKSLFDKFLERLEQDYNTKDHPNIVQDVVCYIHTSQYGLSEEELLDFLNVPSNVWVPLRYALDVFLLKHSGLLRFAYTELRNAVSERYIGNSETREKYARELLGYFLRKYNENDGSLHSFPLQHMVLELTSLLSQVKDWDQLSAVLTDLKVLNQLHSYDWYKVIEYWQSTEFPGEKIAMLYVKALNKAVVNTYLEQWENWEEYGDINPSYTVYKLYYEYLMDIVRSCASFKGREILLYRFQDMLRKMKVDESKREDLLLVNHYQLAVLYVDMYRNKEAEALFKSLLEKYEKKNITTDEQRLNHSHAFHLVGVFHLQQRNFVEANKWFGKSQAIDSQMTGLLKEKANLLTNIGVVNMELGHYDTAEECMKMSLELYEQVFFGELPPDIGGTMMDLALCYRRQGRLDEAKTTYERCLKINKDALGLNHPMVAQIYMNQGTLAQLTDDNVEGERLFRQAYEIFKGLYPPDHYGLLMCQENLAYGLLKLGKIEEAEGHFWEVFNILSRQGRVQNGLLNMQAIFVDHYYSQGLNNSDEEERKKQLEAARTILVKHIPHTTFPLTYHRLACIDRMLPPETPREPQLALDAGIERFPDNEILVTTKLEFDIATTGSLDEVIAFLKKVEENFSVPKIHLTFIVRLGHMRCTDLSGGLAQYTLTVASPDAIYDVCISEFKASDDLGVLLETFTNTLSGLKEYTSVLPFIEKLAEINPDNLSVHMGCMKLAISAMRFDIARKAISYITEHWKDDEEVQDTMTKFTTAVDWAEKEMEGRNETEPSDDAGHAQDSTC